MNEKQIDKIIEDLKKLTKGTMPIIQVFEVNANKLIYSGDQKVGNLDVR